MSSAPRRVALVTGANKGIGWHICKALLAQPGPPLTVLVGSRDEQRGSEAVERLRREAGRQQAGDVVALSLDVADEASVARAAERVKADYGGLDVLVSNAGVATSGDAFDEDIARTTLQTNYYGTRNVFAAFAPLLRPQARVVNVSSASGRSALRKMSEELRRRFLDPALTQPQLDALVESFVRDVASGEYQQKGWPRTAYGVSKAAVTALTRVQAAQVSDKTVLVNCCCPGWVRTDMTKTMQAPLTPDEGAVTPVKLATLPPDSAETGLFWEQGRPSDVV